VVTALAKRDACDARTKLEAFRLYGPRVDTWVLRALVSGVGCARVKCVEIESKQIDDDALLGLRDCDRLVALTLHCIKLTSAAVAPIARCCPTLESLNLAGCSRVCDSGVIAVATHCPRLRDLDLTMCHRVSDRSVAALGVRNQKSLIRVVLDRCLKVRV
jgi:hypothetical protein